MDRPSCPSRSHTARLVRLGSHEGYLEASSCRQVAERCFRNRSSWRMQLERVRVNEWGMAWEKIEKPKINLPLGRWFPS